MCDEYRYVRVWVVCVQASLKKALESPDYNIVLQNHMYGMPPEMYKKYPVLDEWYRITSTSTGERLHTHRACTSSTAGPCKAQTCRLTGTECLCVCARVCVCVRVCVCLLRLLQIVMGLSMLAPWKARSIHSQVRMPFHCMD
jgi:hypothetical protein